jgi:hypothetical protein
LIGISKKKLPSEAILSHTHQTELLISCEYFSNLHYFGHRYMEITGSSRILINSLSADREDKQTVALIKGTMKGP